MKKNIKKLLFSFQEKPKSTQLENTLSSRRRGIQTLWLVWLDSNIDETKDDCCRMITKLREIANTVNMFTDPDQCIQFLTDINDGKALLIVSGSFGQHVVPKIHNMPNIHAIFVFCGDKSRHKQWAEKWSKVTGIFTKINDICEHLKKTAEECNKLAIPMSFVSANDTTTNQNLDQLDSHFMYSIILKEILLEIDFGEQEIKEFLDYCRKEYEGNSSSLAVVRELEREYHSHPPIWWHTRECFIYGVLNKALRTMDVNILIKMGFFINDLHRQIQQLHSEQFGDHKHLTPFVVYRGQGLPQVDFAKLRTTKGGLLSFNNFLSTNINRQVSLEFARMAFSNSDRIGVIFEMTIDPTHTSSPYASIEKFSPFPMEEEILFSTNTVFRINDVDRIDGSDRLWQVTLTMIDNTQGGYELEQVATVIRNEIRGPTGWYRLGKFLLKLGQFDAAEQLYMKLFERCVNDKERSTLYNQLGLVKNSEGEYLAALSYQEKSLQIRKKVLPPVHPDFAESYSNIGVIYYEMGEYSKALEFQEKSLQIRKKALPSAHPDLAESYNNIGVIYNEMGEYSKALEFQEKSLQIRKKALPPTHPGLAESYNNIGTIYQKMGEYSKALEFQEKSLQIRQRILLSTHPDLAESYSSIGVIYNEMGEYSKALEFQEKSLEIRKKALPPTHPDLAESYNNIAVIYHNMKEYSKELTNYQRAVEIGKRSLPSNHPNIQQWENALESAKKNFK
ncbi:unnamed protein product [Rotaria socialis]